MKTIKRTLAVLLTLLMLMSAVPLGVIEVGAEDEWVASGGQQTIDRVESWPSKTSATAGFCTNHALYKKYNVSIPAGDSTTKYEIVNKTTVGYLYWHWCYSHDVGYPINCVFRDSKTGVVKGSPKDHITSNFHAFFSTTPLSFNTKATAYKYSNKSYCPYNYWWAGKTYGKDGQLPVVRVTYQKKVKTTTTATHTVTYNYAYNGGTSATKTSATVTEGLDIDLTPTATKSGFTFVGWNTNASATTGLSSLKMGTSDVTLYAIFKKNVVNRYNLGEETYSFKNYKDSHASGHCFGMSATSSMYYLGLMDKSVIGGNNNTPLYSFGPTAKVKEPICYYQRKQGSPATRAIVAGGTNYKNKSKWDLNSDWNQVVNYVKNHNYDGKGQLQISIRVMNTTLGHAINFIRYESVNGQDRIYVYDNCFPDTEIYLYRASNGRIYETPRAAFGEKQLGCIALRDIAKYYQYVDAFDTTRVIYAATDTISIEGVEPYALDMDVDADLETEYESISMYEVPDDAVEVVITPLVDNASFEYMDDEYNFGAVDDDAYGVFTLLTMDDTANVQEPQLTITKKESPSQQDNLCPWCGKVHEGFFQMIIGWIHSLLAMIFGAKY
ncbi:MAG: InlB B-repeat-containing protein [Clostridia bacterium]|nr:InlB B-repeat-containing protein [Clostridia bacterium]